MTTYVQPQWLLSTFDGKTLSHPVSKYFARNRRRAALADPKYDSPFACHKVQYDIFTTDILGHTT
jgi:hypothetical protein